MKRASPAKVLFVGVRTRAEAMFVGNLRQFGVGAVVTLWFQEGLCRDRWL